MSSAKNFILVILVLILSFSSSSNAIEKKSFPPDFTRISRQFTNVGDERVVNGESMVAMSLVEALQKWADTLEEQISLMRVEIAGLKTSNSHLKDKVMTMEKENVRVTEELLMSTKKLDSLTSKFFSLHGLKFLKLVKLLIL